MENPPTDKSEIKKAIRQLKGQIAEALAGRDRVAVKRLRRRAKRLKRETRRLAAKKSPPAEKPAPPPAG